MMFNIISQRQVKASLLFHPATNPALLLLHTEPTVLTIVRTLFCVTGQTTGLPIVTRWMLGTDSFETWLHISLPSCKNTGDHHNFLLYNDSNVIGFRKTRVLSQENLTRFSWHVGNSQKWRRHLVTTSAAD